jgi:rubrerythrin
MDFKKIIFFKKPRATIDNLKKSLRIEKKSENLYKKAAETAKRENLSEAGEFFRNLVKEKKEFIKQIEMLLDKIK